jgi:DNA-binding transcriptional MerR regulator
MLPQISERKYFSIGEVARLCSIKPHVLRYWEQEFPILQPSKRRGNRRYYQNKEVDLILKIRGLLYDKGYTISGARQLLTQEHPKYMPVKHNKIELQTIIADLEKILRELSI